MFDKSKTPFFSIIIPTYNRASTIARAISSVINQSFGNWELIVIDDGSNDDTKEIVEKFNDVRIRYFWQENQERSAARNYGISLAKGEWICFLDSDDEYMENHLQVFNDTIHKHPKKHIFRTGMIIKSEKDVLVKTKTKATEDVLNCYPFDYILFFSFNRNVFNKYLFDTRFSYLEDMHFLLRCGKEYKFFQIENWTYIYHEDPFQNGRIGKNFERIITNKNACINDMLKFDFNPNKKFLIWTIITNGIFLLYGYLRFRPLKILNGVYINIRNFFQNPYFFLKVVVRIIKVKLFEFLGIEIMGTRF